MPSSDSTQSCGYEALAGDGEVRAIAIGRGLVLGVRDPGRRVVVLERRRVRAAQRGEDARDQHGEGVAAGVDDAGFAQDREQVGPAPHGLLPGLERGLEHVGDQRVLARGVRVGLVEARLAHVGQLAGHAVGHLAHDGQDRALGGLAHGVVGAVGGARHRGADQHRVDELARARRELLRRAADQLREDHAGVAARAEQRRAGDGVDDLLAADLVDLPGGGEAVELVEHRAHRERHVVARVAVGDGEDVEVVDLLAACLQFGQRTLDDGPEADEARIGHRGRGA